MSGLETAAAILGITDVSLNGISLLYNAIQDLKNAPDTIERLKNETNTVQTSLAALKSLDEADEETRAAAKRFGLPQAAETCGIACGKLEKKISRWLSLTPGSLQARTLFATNKSAILSILDDLDRAKQTLILTGVVTGLFIKLGQPISTNDKLDQIARAEQQIAEIDPMPTQTQTQPRPLEEEDSEAQGTALVKHDNRPSSEITPGEFRETPTRIYHRVERETRVSESYMENPNASLQESVGAAREAILKKKEGVLKQNFQENNIQSKGKDVEIAVIDAKDGQDVDVSWVKNEINNQGDNFQFGKITSGRD